MGMEKSDPVRTGRFVAQLRRERGMTQLALAAALRVSHQAVSKWETGVALPDVDLLMALARMFGVRVDDLLAGAAERDVGGGEAEGDEDEDGQGLYSRTMAGLIKTKRDLGLLLEAYEGMLDADVADCVQTLRIADAAVLERLFARMASPLIAQVLKTLRQEALLPLAAGRLEAGDLEDVVRTLGVRDAALLRRLYGQEAAEEA